MRRAVHARINRSLENVFSSSERFSAKKTLPNTVFAIYLNFLLYIFHCGSGFISFEDLHEMANISNRQCM